MKLQLELIQKTRITNSLEGIVYTPNKYRDCNRGYQKQLGLAETLQLLVGCDQTTKEGMGLAKRIEQLFKDKCKGFKEQYKLNFGVYMSPAENLCYTAMTKFKEKYGIIEGVSAYKKDYSKKNIMKKMKEIADTEHLVITNKEIENFLEGMFDEEK